MTALRYVKDDTLAPGLEPGHHAYRILDLKGNLCGVVASGSRGGMTEWTAARIHPSRRLLFGSPMVVAESRGRAAERLIGGRP